jgi:SAM-dependent methyltransferase
MDYRHFANYTSQRGLIVSDLGGFRPRLLGRAYQKILESRSSFFREQLNAWLATIRVRAERVVDAGGGANPVKGKVRSWDVEEYVILDNALERQKIQAHIVADLNQALRPADNPRIASRVGVFDVAFCLEVMEYIWNPVVALANLNLLLRDNAHLYVSFPFVYPMHNPRGHDYLRYTQEGVDRLLYETGFQVEDIFVRRIKNEKLLADAYAADRMHGRHDQTVGHTGYCVTATKMHGCAL